jgi:methionyl aminopeptidase
MTNIKTKDEIKIMVKAGEILANVLKDTQDYIFPLITKNQLDCFIEERIHFYGGKPAFKNFHGYKYASCISINEEVVHGIPDDTIIKNGDIVGIDVGVKYNGYNSDAAITVGIGKISDQAKDLINITKSALDVAILHIKPGVKLGVIQKKIQEHVENVGDYSLVRDFSGHGIGKNLQEEPIIPNYFGKNSHLILKENAVFCIEPMVIIGKNYSVITKNDSWTVISASKNLAAHFEHTIAVTQNGARVLTKI